MGVVSLCSTKNLMLEGGPLPWIVDTSGYYEDGKEIHRISMMQIFSCETTKGIVCVHRGHIGGGLHVGNNSMIFL